jgi:hypothetical protein
MNNPHIPLRIAETPGTRHVMSAPPVLIASFHTIDYTCGKCDAVLMHADYGQVHDLMIHCTECGSYNSTDRA